MALMVVGQDDGYKKWRCDLCIIHLVKLLVICIMMVNGLPVMLNVFQKIWICGVSELVVLAEIKANIKRLRYMRAHSSRNEPLTLFTRLKMLVRALVIITALKHVDCAKRFGYIKIKFKKLPMRLMMKKHI